MVLLKKKTLIHPKADKQKRDDFTADLIHYNRQKRPIIYLDESGFKAYDYRPYGYSLKGRKCHGNYNWQLKSQTNAIGAIYENNLFCVALFDSSINSNIFHTWVEQVLLTEIPKNSVIVMDNATFHKRTDTTELIEKHGHTLLWLPPYSPDLNPIEKIWALVKKKRKEWRLDCIDSLFFYFLWICGSFMVL